jgi:hypothetical protein
MKSAVKIDVVIPESRHVELTLPKEVPAGPAELIVLSGTDQPRRQEPRPVGLDAGKGWIAEDFDAPLPEDLLRLFEGQR